MNLIFIPIIEPPKIKKGLVKLFFGPPFNNQFFSPCTYLFLAKLLSFGKTYISSWLKFYLGKTYIFSWLDYFFLATPISIFGKTFNSWQNLYLLLVEHFSFGKTYISSSLNFFLLAKPIFILG
jgi:hypothetical protein